MAKTKNADPYRKLLRAMVVLLVLAVLFATAYVLLDKYQQGEHERLSRRVEEQNAAMLAEYNAALALQQQEFQLQAEELPERPKPAPEGLDVVDLSSFPIGQERLVQVTRSEMLVGGLLLVNRWHGLPGDFFMVEPELKSVMTETNIRVPVTDNRVVLFPAAISALDDFIRDAKEQGLEHYIIREGFRTMESQTEKWNREVSKYTDRLSGDALDEKARQSVAYPGTSDYQSGFSFSVDVYDREDSALNASEFQTTRQAEWLNENGWKYGIVFRFPIQNYPDADTVDKSYKTGINIRLDAYRYVGVPHAAVMHLKGFCLEEYIEYLAEHPHIEVYEDGKLKYGIFRQENVLADTGIRIPEAAKAYTVSADNMGGLICALSY